jgi:hypothetical protein
MYANSINTGPIRDGIIRVGKAPHTSPKFFGGRRDTKKTSKHAARRIKQVGPELTRHGISTARKQHGTYTI